MKHRTTHDVNGLIIEINDDVETRNLLYDKLLEFFLQNSAACSGEGLYQSDSAQVNSLEIIAEIADNILEIETKYEDD